MKNSLKPVELERPERRFLVYLGIDAGALSRIIVDFDIGSE
jgi:hypothetical protein